VDLRETKIKRVLRVTSCNLKVVVTRRSTEFDENLFKMKETPKTRKLIEFEATDKKIDRMVYELYGLTEEEIGIVDQL
jgi:hypothetical protein